MIIFRNSKPILLLFSVSTCMLVYPLNLVAVINSRRQIQRHEHHETEYFSSQTEPVFLSSALHYNHKDASTLYKESTKILIIMRSHVDIPMLTPSCCLHLLAKTATKKVVSKYPTCFSFHSINLHLDVLQRSTFFSCLLFFTSKERFLYSFISVIIFLSELLYFPNYSGTTLSNIEKPNF